MLVLKEHYTVFFLLVIFDQYNPNLSHHKLTEKQFLCEKTNKPFERKTDSQI